MSNDEIKMSAVARFFSASVMKEFALYGRSPILARLIRESGIGTELNPADQIATIFDLAFNWLEDRRHRTEYTYKAALAEKVLLGTHSLQTASMLTEFSVVGRRADVVILNGTGTVYEIKSERDSLKRLVDQIDAYSQVFARVNVIVGENHLQEVEHLVPDHVGIMLLSDRYQVSTVKPSIEDPGRTNPDAIFKAINQREAMRILKSAGKHVPDVPNTKRYNVLREMFIEFDPAEVHHRMVECLKQTRNLLPLSEVLHSVPKSLYTAVLAARFNRQEQDRIVDALNTTVCDAEAWG